MNVTANIVCYKSKTLSNGEHPLMIRVCKDGKKKYKSLGVSVNPKFWNFEKNTLKPNSPNYEYLSRIIADWKSHATLTLLAKQDLPTFGYNMIDPLKSWCWGAILFYPFKISRFS